MLNSLLIINSIQENLAIHLENNDFTGVKLLTEQTFGGLFDIRGSSQFIQVVNNTFHDMNID